MRLPALPQIPDLMKVARALRLVTWAVCVLGTAGHAFYLVPALGVPALGMALIGVSFRAALPMMLIIMLFWLLARRQQACRTSLNGSMTGLVAYFALASAALGLHLYS